MIWSGTMNYNDEYYGNLHKKYKGKKVEYQTPTAPRITWHKRSLLKGGLPIVCEEGVVDANDRGDLIFTFNNGEITHYVNTPDSSLKLKNSE